MTFERKQSILGSLRPKRALIVYGPRRIGKTTLLQAYLREYAVEKKTLYTLGDDMALRRLFQSEERKQILDFATPYEVIAIDEAQYIPRIGLGAKMIVDAFPKKTLILTGSSSFDLSREVGEPLTGRHFTLTLLPIAQSEVQASGFELQQALEEFLVYGSYPEVLLEPDHARKAQILNELVSSYLFKDVLALDRIKSPDVLLDIARCVAFQVGSEVSWNEIARTVRTDVKTVGRYLDLLEKMFVVRRVRGFSRNLRNEISKKAKYYFLDTGVRNAVIGNFHALTARDDVGRLWENFVFMELVKQSTITGALDSYYFWRTHAGQEIDIIKESGGAITGIEAKWTDDVARPPSTWRTAYPSATFMVINRTNYLDVLRPPQ